MRYNIEKVPKLSWKNKVGTCDVSGKQQASFESRLLLAFRDTPHHIKYQFCDDEPETNNSNTAERQLINARLVINQMRPGSRHKRDYRSVQLSDGRLERVFIREVASISVHRTH